jgi:hypothetical protein
MFNTQLPWSLDHHRYVVLGVPRSGTQLLEAFINYSLSKQHTDVVSLQEIFTVQACLVNTIKSESGKLRIYNESDVTFPNVARVAKERLDIIASADSVQALTCRVFLDDRMASKSFVEGINYLKDLNFKFVYIERSFEHKIISAMFAKKSFIFSTYRNNMMLDIDIDELKSFVVARYMIEQQHKKIIDNLIQYDTVDYDTVVSKADGLNEDERKLAFGIYREKQLALDPYEQIVNASEVKEVFTDFYPKLISLASQLL